MHDANDHIELAIDLFAGFPRTDLPNSYQEAMIDDEMIRDFAQTLLEQYPTAVQQNIWAPMNLRRSLDYFLDESDPTVKRMVFGDHVFSEAERSVIWERSAELIYRRLQRRCHLTVCYKTFPNGRVGYRLE